MRSMRYATELRIERASHSEADFPKSEKSIEP